MLCPDALITNTTNKIAAIATNFFILTVEITQINWSKLTICLVLLHYVCYESKLVKCWLAWPTTTSRRNKHFANYLRKCWIGQSELKNTGGMARPQEAALEVAQNLQTVICAYLILSVVHNSWIQFYQTVIFVNLFRLTCFYFSLSVLRNSNILIAFSLLLAPLYNYY